MSTKCHSGVSIPISAREPATQFCVRWSSENWSYERQFIDISKLLHKALRSDILPLWTEIELAVKIRLSLSLYFWEGGNQSKSGKTLKQWNCTWNGHINCRSSKTDNFRQDARSNGQKWHLCFLQMQSLSKTCLKRVHVKFCNVVRKQHLQRELVPRSVFCFQFGVLTNESSNARGRSYFFPCNLHVVFPT